MFGFSNSFDDDEDNTPFFSDNNEQSSIFNNQSQQEFSAFDLFNSKINSQIKSSGVEAIAQHNNSKSKRKSSKKSLILQLDEFERSQTFDNIEKKYQQLTEQEQGNYLKPHPYYQDQSRHMFGNQLQESRVQRFEQNTSLTSYNQVINKKPNINKFQLNRDPKNNKINHKQVNFGFNAKKQKQQQESNQNKYISHKNQDNNEIMTKNDKLVNLKQSKKQQCTKQTNLKLLIAQQYSFKQDYKQSRPDLIPKKDEIPKKQIQQLNIKPNLKIIDPLASKNQKKKDQKNQQSKGFKFNFLQNSLAPKFSNQLLKKSNALLKDITAQQAKSNSQIQQTNKFATKQQKNISKQNINKSQFDNILRKSQVSQTITHSNQIKQRYIQNQFGLKKSFDFHKNNKKDDRQKSFVGNGNSVMQQKQKQIKIQQQKKHTQMHKTDQQKIQKQQHKMQIKMRYKQKPCFNLKLVKQIPKEQQTAEYALNKQKQKQKNLQYTKIVKQQISKRDNLATVKFLKNQNLTKAFNFQKPKMNDIKEQIKQKYVQVQNKTPKIPRIQIKIDKQYCNRQTQKLIKPEQIINKKVNDKQNEDGEDASQQNIQIRRHLIDYEKFEDEMNALNEEIEQTKKKYLNCQDGYKNIFLLLNKTNLILSGRFMSQIQCMQERNRS